MSIPLFGSLRVQDCSVPYRIRRSNRVRSVRLRVGPRPELEIVVPAGARLPDPVLLIQHHGPWILRQLQQLSPIQDLCTGAILPFRGEDLVLEVTAGGSKAMVSLQNLRLHIAVPVGVDIEDVLEPWFREQARAVITRRVAYWSRTTNISYGRIAIRDQKSRWGSCSSLGNLNFNWRLVMAPPAVLDYVIIHELIHRLEANHSQHFWQGVARYCPEYHSHRRWLLENGTKLAGYFLPYPGA